MDNKTILDQILRNCLLLIVTKIDISEENTKYVKVSKDTLNSIEFLLTEINPDLRAELDKTREEYLKELQLLKKKNFSYSNFFGKLFK